MPIEKVILENFKTHVRTEIPLSPLTVLVGPNSVGKTSVLEAIQYVADLAGSHAWMGRLHDYLRRGARDCSVRVEVSPDGDAFIEFSVTGQVGKTTTECTWRSGGMGGSLSREDATFDLSLGARRILRDDVGAAKRLRLDADRLVAPSKLEVGEKTTELGHDGSDLAGVLGIMRLFDEPLFDSISQDLRLIVPTVERIRIVKASIRETRREPLHDEEPEYLREHTVVIEGAELRFDFVGAPDIHPRDTSEGTLLALGVLTASRMGRAPRMVLLDDIERALHPRAQRKLVEILRFVVEKTPGLQIIATSHSPYLVDAFRPEEVIVLGLRKDGTAAARRLSDHPDAKRAMEVLSTGEFLAAEQEDWVVKETP